MLAEGVNYIKSLHTRGCQKIFPKALFSHLMLLCEDHGLASCAQGYWTFFHDNVRAVTSAPYDLMLACGLAIGFEDAEAPINRVHSARASIDEFATFID